MQAVHTVYPHPTRPRPRPRRARGGRRCALCTPTSPRRAAAPAARAWPRDSARTDGPLAGATPQAHPAPSPSPCPFSYGQPRGRGGAPPGSRPPPARARAGRASSRPAPWPLTPPTLFAARTARPPPTASRNDPAIPNHTHLEPPARQRRRAPEQRAMHRRRLAALAAGPRGAHRRRSRWHMPTVWGRAAVWMSCPPWRAEFCGLLVIEEHRRTKCAASSLRPGQSSTKQVVSGAQRKVSDSKLNATAVKSRGQPR